MFFLVGIYMVAGQVLLYNFLRQNLSVLPKTRAWIYLTLMVGMVII